MENLTLLLVAMVIIAFVTNIFVEVEKKVVTNFPSNLLVVITASIITILAFIGYMTYLKITIEGYMIVGMIVMCGIESYIAMFGYDKFIQTLKQYKEYIAKVK